MSESTAPSIPTAVVVVGVKPKLKIPVVKNYAI